jgi:DNA-binding YbaB/EbfC family protein
MDDLGMEGLNMADMFGKMMEMQQKMADARDALASKTVTAEAGGGMVKVTANGVQKITAIKIEADAVDPDDIELLEDLVIAGVNKALDEAADMAKDEMSKTAGGFLPPGMDLSQFGL